MKLRTITFLSLGLVVKLGGIAGCAEVPADPKELVEPTFEAQSALVAGMPTLPKRVRFLRRLPEQQVEPRSGPPPYDFRESAGAELWKQQEAIIQANKNESGWAEEPEFGRTRVIYTDENNDEWEWEYSVDDLLMLRDLGTARGIDLPSGPRLDEDPALLNPPSLEPQALSFTSDQRVPKAINGTYPLNHNVLMRMGWLTGQGTCTATMVGRRLVLTAAHCVVSLGGSADSATYFPRRDNNTSPWGSESQNGSIRPSAYNAHNCFSNYTTITRETCSKYDWILLRLPNTAWASGTPSWMGYWAPSTAGGWFGFNDGYPGCNNADSPNPCVNPRIYGENVGHSTIDYRGTVSGELATFNSANDHSSGHSGGAIYSTTYPDSSGPYLLGIITNAFCGTCTEPGLPTQAIQYPTMVRRMTGALGGQITDWRTLYP